MLNRPFHGIKMVNRTCRWIYTSLFQTKVRGEPTELLPNNSKGINNWSLGLCHWIQKSGWRFFYLLNGMCLSQPSSLYQRCFLFPFLKGPGFPAVFLENFPIFEGFLRAKCFPTVKGRAQGCKKKRKKSKIPETNPYPGEEHLPPNIANMHKTCYVFFSMVCARLNFLFYFILPGGPGEEPLEFLPPEVP